MQIPGIGYFDILTNLLEQPYLYFDEKRIDIAPGDFSPHFSCTKKV